MKNILYITRLLLCMLPMGFMACNDYEDDRLDYSNNAPQYVKFTSVTAKNLVEGDTLVVQVEAGVAQSDPVNVNYSITGDITQQGTVTIPAFTKTARFNIIATDNSTPTATKNSTITITGVSGGLTVGRMANLSTSFKLKIVDDVKIAHFEAPETNGLESVDTVMTSFSITNPATSTTTITYTVSGGVAGVDYVDVGNGTAIIKKGESSVPVPIEIIDNILRNDPPVILTVKITGATSADTETSVDQEGADVLEYIISDDLKTVGIEGGDLELKDLTKAKDVGTQTFNISMDASPLAKTVVGYTIIGAGVTDVTEGVVTFYPGGTLSQQIVIELTDVAFSVDQQVAITLTSITSADEEVVFAQDEDGNDIGTTIKLGLKK